MLMKKEPLTAKFLFLAHKFYDRRLTNLRPFQQYFSHMRMMRGL